MDIQRQYQFNDQITLMHEVYFEQLDLGSSRLLFFGWQTCDPGHFYGPYIRSHGLMVYVRSGKGIFKSRNVLYHLEKGSTFFIFPGETIYYKADDHDPWEYCWIGFSGDTIPQMLIRASVSAGHPVHMVADGDPSIDTLYRQIEDYCVQKNNIIDLKLLSLFLDVVYHYIISSNYSPTPPVTTTQSNAYIEKAVEYIMAHYNRQISVSEVAAHVGISREHFGSLFKKHFNITPVRFIKDYQLKCSAQLLLTTNYTVAQIAEMVGFNDYNYFSNQFSRAYHASPSEYRRLGREKNII